MNIGQFPAHRMQKMFLVRGMLDLIDLDLACLGREPSDHPALADVQGRIRRPTGLLHRSAGRAGWIVNLGYGGM